MRETFYRRLQIFSIVLVMSERVFKIRAIPLWHIIIFAILSFYMAIGVFTIVTGVIGWPVILLFSAFFGSLFFLFFSIIFSKIKVYEDGISFRMYHVYFDEISKIQLKWGGRLLVFGKLNWYLLLNPEEFIRAIKAVKPEALVEYRKPVKRWKPMFYPMITIVSIMALWAIGYVLGWMGIAVDPFAWALVWGITVTLSTVAWAYWLPPHRYRILGLGRLGTAVIMGLAIGIPVFFIMLTRLFV